MTYVYAHRGASRYAPENTMAAFRLALELGADGIELDVQLSKDNIPVVIHDENIKRTTDAKGLVSEYTVQQLQCFDAGCWFSERFKGERFPTLEEVLRWIKSTPLLLNIELKNTILPYHGMERAVYDLVERYKLSDRVIYSSFNHYSLREMQRIHRKNEIAPLYSSGLYEPWEYARKLNAKSAHPHWRTLNTSIVKNFKKHGIKLRPYTVNDPKRMRLFFDQQIDAIITDVPDVAKDVLAGVHIPTSSKFIGMLHRLNPLK